MPHNYKNYVHLEGVVNQDAISEHTERGLKVSFTLAVKETTRDADGNRVEHVDIFTMEMGDANSRFMASLRKGTPVMVDGQIKLRSMIIGGDTYPIATIKVHRVHSVDFNGWRKEQNG